jgi:hypothetical protein
MPFCIVLLKKHNIIIGHKWLKYFKIDLAVADHKLLWPQSLLPTYFFDKLIKVTCESIALQQINLLNQANTKRRDRALDQEDCQQNPAPSITILSTANVSTADAAGPKERKLWTPTIRQHNYADKQ